MKKSIYIFRHGQTDWNIEGKMQGHRDIPLNENGIAQARELKDKIKTILKEITSYKVVSSDLKRSVKTCQICFENEVIDIHQGLREIDVGEYEEKNRHEIGLNFQNPQPGFRFPGGESIEEHSYRLLKTLNEITSSNHSFYFLSTHGGSMARILEKSEGYIHKKIENCDIAKIELDKDQLIFKSFL